VNSVTTPHSKWPPNSRAGTKPHNEMNRSSSVGGSAASNKNTTTFSAMMLQVTTGKVRERIVSRSGNMLASTLHEDVSVLYNPFG